VQEREQLSIIKHENLRFNNLEEFWINYITVNVC